MYKLPGGPHAAIRMKIANPDLWWGPPTFKSMDYKGQEFSGMKLTIQTAPEIALAAAFVCVCPAKNKKKRASGDQYGSSTSFARAEANIPSSLTSPV